MPLTTRTAIVTLALLGFAAAASAQHTYSTLYKEQFFSVAPTGSWTRALCGAKDTKSSSTAVPLHVCTGDAKHKEINMANKTYHWTLYFDQSEPGVSQCTGPHPLPDYAPMMYCNAPFAGVGACDGGSSGPVPSASIARECVHNALEAAKSAGKALPCGADPTADTLDDICGKVDGVRCKCFGAEWATLSPTL